MDLAKQNLMGSPLNDLMKQKHKLGPANHYASDIDLLLISFDPPGIVAVLDYKRVSESVTPTEQLAYAKFLDMGIPVYIISCSESYYQIFPYDKFQGLLSPTTVEGDEGLHKWESKLRSSWKRQMNQLTKSGKIVPISKYLPAK